MKIKKAFSKFEVFLLDLDGVIWRGGDPIPGAVEVVNFLVDYEKEVIFITNNTTLDRKTYKNKLFKIGIKADKVKIVTSGYATAVFLRQKYGLGTVFLIGEEGIRQELKDFKIVEDYEGWNPSIDYVVVSLDRNVHYWKIAKAAHAIRKGALFVLTNPDNVLPIEEGVFIPGAGSIAAAVEVASSKKPDHIIGKPSPIIFKVALKNKDVQKTIMIGDRIDTDVLGASQIGLKTALVLTGVTTLKDVKNSPVKPNYILTSIRDLILY